MPSNFSRFILAFLLVAAASLQLIPSISAAEIIALDVTAAVRQIPVIGLLNFSVSAPNVTVYSSLQFSVELQNLGNDVGDTVTEVSVYNSAGVLVDTFQINASVFPLETVIATKSWSAYFSPGNYTAVGTVFYDNATDGSGSVNFTILPEKEKLPKLRIAVDGECVNETVGVRVTDEKGDLVVADVTLKFRRGPFLVVVAKESGDMLFFRFAEAGRYLVEASKSKYQSASAEFSLMVCAPPPEVPGVPPIVPGVVPINIAESPLMTSVDAGRERAAVMLLSNPSNYSIDVNVSVIGIPAEWLAVPTNMTLIPGETNFSLNLTIPEAAVPGEYPVEVRFRGVGFEASSEINVRIDPPLAAVDVTKPRVKREIRVVGNTSNVNLVVKNGNQTAELLQVYERIPKEFARDVDEIDFEVEPTRIIESDPVVAWDFEDVAPFEEKRVGYSLAKGLTAGEVMGWEVEQINVVTAAPPELLRIVELFVPKLERAATKTVTLTVLNYAGRAIDANFSLELPGGWISAPSVRAISIPGRESSRVVFDITVPADAVAGTHYGALLISYDNRTLRQGLPLLVEVPPAVVAPAVPPVLEDVLRDVLTKENVTAALVLLIVLALIALLKMIMPEEGRCREKGEKGKGNTKKR